ncbi:MAG: Chorismate synthase [Ktedonobacterales bacterium]|jgi:chorismate synthase|nr:MAG: Chorismate synthase [Ktedonobacterales bacterium]
MFRFLTAGESHGPSLTAIVEGLPAGLPFSKEIIDEQLRRRQGGYGRGGRMKIERDEAQVLSGVRHGHTLGSPITLRIENRDWPNWQERMTPDPVDAPPEPVTRVRPGHADLPGALKYGQSDVREVIERASSRETAARVAVGALCRQLLGAFGVAIHSHVVSVADVGYPANALPDVNTADAAFWERVEASEMRCADAELTARMIERILAGKRDGDTCGGVFEVVATGVPIGLGGYVQWDQRLSARLGQAMLSIPSAKGVEIGGGFALAALPGSRVHDVVRYDAERGWHHLSNNAGGVEGGISNGEAITVRVAVKPIPTLAHPLPSADVVTGENIEATRYERSDVCVVPAAGVVGEAMLAIVLAAAWLEKFGGDSLDEMRRNYDGYLATLAR